MNPRLFAEAIKKIVLAHDIRALSFPTPPLSGWHLTEHAILVGETQACWKRLTGERLGFEKADQIVKRGSV